MTPKTANEPKQVKSKRPEAEEQIRELTTQLAEMEANWKRALADYQNAQKRQQQQQQLMAQLACSQLVERLLPALDHLELAASHLNDSGLAMVAKQFEDALAAEGISVIEAAGEDFDPNRMECIEQVPGTKDKVISVIVRGYQAGSQIIRPAKVRVGTGEEHKESKE
jgi:molecular chaperone GrpE